MITDIALTGVSGDSLLAAYAKEIQELHESTGVELGRIISSYKEKKQALINNQDAQERLIASLVALITNKAHQDVDYSVNQMLSVTTRQTIQHFIQFLLEYSAPLTDSLRQSIQMLRDVCSHDEYQQWIVKHDIREVDIDILAERMMLHWTAKPTMHFFMLVLPGEEQLLASTIDSLTSQFYENWHFTVISPLPVPESAFNQVDFLHWRTLSDVEDPYQVLNAEINQNSTHWISFIEPGTKYIAHALLKIADAINVKPASSFIYTDDDEVSLAGKRKKPRFKPDFNLDLLRSSPYIGSCWVPAESLVAVGGIQAVPGAENYDLALRWVDIFSELAFHHITDVLTHQPESLSQFNVALGQQALEAHFERRQISVEISEGYVENSYRVEYLYGAQPKVSILIPNKDKFEYLQPCIDSLLANTSYPDFEVLVIDNQSTDQDVLAYYEVLKTQYPDKVKVVSYDKPFNFADMNNWAADQAQGEFLLLLNNDTQVIQADWLTRMVMHGQRDDVGIVGARLLYPESGLLQHGGVVLGIAPIAEHPYNNQIGMNDSSHMDRMRLDQNLSAVTAAVMLVKKTVYESLHGMDSDNLAVLFNDVDLCIRAGQLGYRIVWTPYAMVIHHGSTSMGEKGHKGYYFDYDAEARQAKRKVSEHRYMLKKWLPLLANDSAYNPHLSMESSSGYRIDINAPLNWDTDHHLRLRCYGVPIKAGASREYRLMQPFDALSKAGKACCEYGDRHLTLTELARLSPDTVVFQNAVEDISLEIIRQYREFCPEVKLVLVLDDLLDDIPEKNSLYKHYKAKFRDMRTRLRRVLGYFDRLIVTTEPLKAFYADKVDDICVVPNRLKKEQWLGFESLRQQSDKPRVGWAGGGQHHGDLEVIIDVVKQTANEIDWIFLGMCIDEIKPYLKEFHEPVPMDKYPEKLASLNLDLAVAPLEIHDFNRAKSNLRLLEFGVHGWPVVCTDIDPYQTNDAPVVRVPNDTDAWVTAIRQILADKETLHRSGDTLQQWVMQNYLLEDHVDEWEKSFDLSGL